MVSVAHAFARREGFTGISPIQILLAKFRKTSGEMQPLITFTCSKCYKGSFLKVMKPKTKVSLLQVLLYLNLVSETYLK